MFVTVHYSQRQGEGWDTRWRWYFICVSPAIRRCHCQVLFYFMSFPI